MSLEQKQKIDQLLQNFIFILFNIIIFLTPFVFTWFNQELFEFNKMIFVYALSILIVTSYIARMILRQQVLWQWHKGDWLIGAFLLSQIISTVFSMHQRTSWFGYYTRFNGGLLSTITYLALFYSAKNNLLKEQIKLLLNSLLLSSFFISLYAIPEHFGHSPSCLIVTQKFNVSCWVQDVQNRVFATFGQPNWLAAFLVMVIPLNIWRLWQKPKTVWLYLLLILNSSALFFTKSRSGILALALALAFQFLFKFLKNFQEKKGQTKNIARQLILPSLILGISFLFSGNPLQLNLQKNTPTLEQNIAGDNENLPTTTIQTGGSKSSAIRQVVWKGALKIWQRHPIFGSGVETFAYSYYLDRPAQHNLLSEWDFLYNKAHNELLNYLANSGLFGLTTYLTLFLALAWNVLVKWRQKKLQDLDLAITTSLLAMFVSNFFGFSTVVTNLLFAILAAMLFQEIEWPKLKNNNNWLKILFIPLLLIFAWLSFANWRIWQADYLFTNGNNYLAKNDYQTGLTLIQKAIKKSPKEALFYDEMATQYSQLATAFAQEQDATKSSQFAQAAIQTSDFVQELNPVHLNFYKSRAKIFLRLAQLNPEFYPLAKEVLLTALDKAPTDAKLFYNLSLIDEVLKENESAKRYVQQAIKLKSNYGQARFQLAEILIAESDFDAAQMQYQYILYNIDPDSKLAQENLAILEASLSAQSAEN